MPKSDASFVAEPECDLQYYWASLDHGTQLSTRDGARIVIESPGLLNRSAGPDFLNARVRIGGECVVGDIEIHQREADWYAHQHHLDPRYQHVILHVIQESSTRRLRLETVLLDDCSGDLEFSTHESAYGRCSDLMERVSDDALLEILKESGIERFKLKAEKIAFSILKFGGEVTALQLLFDAFGFKNNRKAFRALFNHWQTCSPDFDLDTMPAWLWGLSDLLPDTALPTEIHPELRPFLKQIWEDYAKCRSMVFPPVLWERAGSRPANSPERRVAGLIALLQKYRNAPLTVWLGCVEKSESSHALLENLTESLSGVLSVFSTFWNWKKKSEKAVSLVGASRVNDILVNVALPLLYAHALLARNSSTAQNVLEAWCSLKMKPDNRILKQAFQMCFGPVQQHRAERFMKSIVTQQGLIHLFLNFCEINCSDCRSCRMIHSASEVDLPNH